MERGALLLLLAFLCALSTLLPVASARAVPSTTEEHEYANLHVDSWSWVVALMLKQHKDNGIYHRHHCAGSLIKPQWVLTASHCFDEQAGGADLEKWTVRFSEHGFQPPDERGAGDKDIKRPVVTAGVEHVIRHPHYNREKVLGDIALVRLDRNMTQLPGGHPVSLPSLPLHSSNFTRGLRCSAVGWKCPDDGSGDLCTAYEVEMPLKGDRVCDFYHLKHWGEKLCMGSFDTGRGVCQGDSGGPLVCYDALQDKRVLAGVLSFVHIKRPLQYPAGYTDVSTFLDWIHDTLELN